MSIRDQQAFANSSGNGAIVNSGNAPRPVPVGQANPTQQGYTDANQAAYDSYAKAQKEIAAREQWASQQMTDAQQTGAGATGGRNNSAWQDQARYGYTDGYNGAHDPRYTAKPGANSEGAVDWNMMGTGGGYEEKERKDANSAMNSWRNDQTINNAAYGRAANRDIGTLTQNTGDVRESWRNFQDLDTGATQQQNVRRGMGGTAAKYSAQGGMAQMNYGGAQPGFAANRGFGGGGMAQGGTYDGVPEQQSRQYGQTQGIRWQ